MRIYIYALFDPLQQEKIRYVGQTANLEQRFKQHMAGREKLTSAWVKQLKLDGRLPSVRVLEETNEMNASAIEAKWIIANDSLDLLNVNKRAIENKFLVSPIITLRDMELKYIRWVMEKTGGNKLDAARLLGIGRQTLYNKLNQAES